MMIRRLAGALALLAIGCGSSGAGADDDGPGGGPSACEALADECNSKQQVCDASGSEPVCAFCPAGEIPSSGTECEAIPGEPLAHQFGSTHLEPGFEDDNYCQAWTLDNEEPIWFRSVEMLNGGGYHHSNWFFVPEDRWTLPDGSFACRESGFTEIEAAALGGVLFAQGTQSTQEAQVFNEGIGIKIPARSRIIGWTHVLNTRPDVIDSELELKIFTVPPEEVSTPLYLFRLNFSAIEIPPRSETELTGNCDFDAAISQQTGEPFDMRLHYVMPHYHLLGTGFRLAPLGGPRNDEAFFDLVSPEPRGRTFDTPVDLSGARGFRFTCSYMNPRDETVQFGVGDQEMCVMLGFGDRPFLYDGNVVVKERVDDGSGVARFEGDCDVIAGPVPDGR